MTQANTNAAKANEIEWSCIEGGNTDFETVYPRLQWIHGDPKVEKGIMHTGGLFISAELYRNFEAKGFSPQTLITNDGKRIEGYGAAAAKLAVIRIKQQWITDKESGKNVPLLHALVFAEGCDDLLCLSLKGPSKSLPFNKEFQIHQSQNVAFANKTRPADAKAIEPFALWFPLKAGEISTISAKDGKSSSKVTYPELSKPEKLDRDYFMSLWVGGTNYKTFAQAWRDTKDWQKAPIWKQVVESDDIEHLDGLLHDAAIKQLLDLAIIKEVDEKEFCLTLTNGETNCFEGLRISEGKIALEQLQTL